MNSNVKVQGFYKNIRATEREVVRPGSLQGTFRGFHLDELQISAVITTQADIDNFIKFLQEIRPCFK